MQKSNFTVIYDTNVLYPACLRDILIRLAQKELFRAKWTHDILAELKRNLLESAKVRNEKNGIFYAEIEEKIDRLLAKMNEAVRDCLITDYKDLKIGLILPDSNDKHVLAAAIKSKSDVIVTWNLKDFPQKILNKYNIEAQSPDDFISHVYDLDEEAVLLAVREQRAGLKNPTYTSQQLLESFKKNKLYILAENLKDSLNRI